MQIGYSEETLRMNICKQFADIESDFNWMVYYFHQKDWECVEECASIIQESLDAVLENIDILKDDFFVINEFHRYFLCYREKSNKSI